jgi:hypothetical protein
LNFEATMLAASPMAVSAPMALLWPQGIETLAFLFAVGIKVYAHISAVIPDGNFPAHYGPGWGIAPSSTFAFRHCI